MSNVQEIPHVGIGLKETIVHGSSRYHIGFYPIKMHKGCHIVQYLHWHDEYEIFVITKGGCEMSLNNTKIPLFKGDMLLIYSGIIHGAKEIPNMDCEFNAFVFGQDLVESFNNDMPNTILQKVFARTRKSPIKIDGSIYDETQREAYFLSDAMMKLNEERPEGFELLTKAKLLELLGLFWQYSSKSKDIGYNSLASETNFKKALMYMNENYAKPFTLDELAAYANLSKSQLERVFKSNMGISPVTYLIHMRVSKSINLLINSDANISQIAYEVGFNDFSYYGKCFKKIIGMTPREFRKERAADSGEKDRKDQPATK